MSHSSCPGLAVQRFSSVTPHNKMHHAKAEAFGFSATLAYLKPCCDGKVKRSLSLNQWKPGAGHRDFVLLRECYRVVRRCRSSHAGHGDTAVALPAPQSSVDSGRHFFIGISIIDDC